jgi:hypothetical protein
MASITVFVNGSKELICSEVVEYFDR